MIFQLPRLVEVFGSNTADEGLACWGQRGERGDVEGPYDMPWLNPRDGILNSFSVHTSISSASMSDSCLQACSDWSSCISPSDSEHWLPAGPPIQVPLESFKAKALSPCRPGSFRKPSFCQCNRAFCRVRFSQILCRCSSKP